MPVSVLVNLPLDVSLLGAKFRKGKEVAQTGTTSLSELSAKPKLRGDVLQFLQIPDVH